MLLVGSRSASPRPDQEERGASSNSLYVLKIILFSPYLALPSCSHVWGSLRSNHSGSSGSAIRLSSRGRIWLRRRGGARGLIARWPIIPASEVPDELVDQAMSVLQDKSRDMVIRELQRTVSCFTTITTLIPIQSPFPYSHSVQPIPILSFPYSHSHTAVTPIQPYHSHPVQPSLEP